MRERFAGAVLATTCPSLSGPRDFRDGTEKRLCAGSAMVVVRPVGHHVTSVMVGQPDQTFRVHRKSFRGAAENLVGRSALEPSNALTAIRSERAQSEVRLRRLGKVCL